MGAHDDWERLKSGKLLRELPGTSGARIEPIAGGFRWGIRIHADRRGGVEKTEKAAQEAVWNRYREFVFSQWLKGTNAQSHSPPYARWVCPLS